ncbi:MAG: hypothetical protein R2761_16200 [Acidimicrobiales bacterium]
MSRLHDWSHQLRAKPVRQRAYADPSTRCWRCGLTLAEVRLANPGRRIEWHAGHTEPTRYAPLLAECSLCNWRNAAETTAAKRATSGGTGRF